MMTLVTHSMPFIDNSSFIRNNNSRWEQPLDNTCRIDLSPDKDRSYNFQPFKVIYRNFIVKQLPLTFVQLFQHFMPVFLVEK